MEKPNKNDQIIIPDFLSGEQELEAVRWFNKAAEIARNALCLRTKCGAVIVKDGEIIGTGYNAPPLDKEENRTCNMNFAPGKPKYDQTCCMHAEWRAIEDALRRNPAKLTGSTLYFTRVNEDDEIKKSGDPFCTTCSRWALDTGIVKFVLWHNEGIREYPTAAYNRLSYQYTPPTK